MAPTPERRPVTSDDEDELGEDGMDDMINILDLNEQTILRNIERRYCRKQIYTYTGSILVAVNPYSKFNIYGLDMVKKYQDELLGAQPPHLFALGSAAYSSMVNAKENQVIVISGESGAGKTESTKLIMQYLAAVNTCVDNTVTEQILEASPLLEAFGNAKTIRNDNSSRFGKYVEIHFKSQQIVGATTSEYLLEKSRIVAQMADERNYHVFYEMLAGLNGKQKDDMGLQSADKYFYLNQGGASCDIESKDDKKDFDSLLASMEVLGFSTVEKSTIWGILAAVLHMGNVYFSRKQNEHQSEGVELASEAQLKWVSHLLKLSADWLKQGITMKVTEARKERLFTPLNIDQALDARDAISKALYQCLFSWLVQRVNDIVSCTQSATTHSIALLDIFGFEDFKVNSFEQLCINYANETLQFYFNKHVFQIEQHEYIREQISWKEIVFSDNQPTIDLISKKPNGIIHIMNDESNLPKGTDQSFLEKTHYAHETNAFYGKPRLSAPEFSIKHYAGFVTYNVRNFLDKNKDTLRNDVVDLMIQSQNGIISKMFQDYRDNTINKTMTKMAGHYVTMKPRTPTVVANFHQSLLHLIETMSKCSPWFVRCLKPNNFKEAMMFDKEVVLSQLRYTGMLETIRIRKMGFPVRLRFRTFCQKYYVLFKNNSSKNDTYGEDKNTCHHILSKALTASWKSSWQIGISKVFMKESLSYHLEDLKHSVTEKAVIVLQQMARGLLARKQYMREKRATLAVQSAIRSYLARKRFTGLVRGVLLAQAQIRMQLQRRRYKQHLSQIRARERDMKQRHAQLETERREAERLREIRKQQEKKWPEPPAQTYTRSLDKKKMSAPAERSAKLDNYSSDLHKWQCVHSEYNLEVHRHNITQLSEDTTLPADIDTHVFSKYANIYFKHPYRCLDKGIDQPFLSKQNPKDSQDAVNLFAMVLAYMNDGQLSAKNEHLQANYIVQHCLENQALTDEFYCQIVNQTWQNKDLLALHRGWKLMCTALSAIPPSPPISNYLLKYVSDHGYNGYKNVCQHKLLECKELTPDRARNYPPTLLEWNCAEKQSGMALQARLSDGQNATAAVQSWTTGDEYTANLLQSRHVDSGCFGWTVMLQDNNVQYELSGDDYVLDLISEIEHPPGAPYCTRPFIVSHDKPEGSNSKPFQDSPHDPELDKVSLWNIAEMHQPVPVSPRPAPAMAPRSPAMPSQAAPVPSTSTQPQPPVLSNSVLNKRQTIHDPSLAQDSMLNIRYVQHSGAGSASPSNNAQQPRPVTIPAPPIDHNGTDFPEYNDDFELSNNRLNQRYNGSAEPSIDGARPPVKQPTPDQRYSNAWENRGSVKSKSSDPSNLEDWVDNMFNDALGSGFDDFSDARTLSNRLKGGGQGLPGVAQPPPPPAPPLLNGLPPGNLVTSGNPLGNGTLPSSVPPVNYVHAAPQPPTINPTYTGPMQGAIPLGAFPVMPDPTTQILLQAQQMAQQQAAVQQVAAQQAAAQQYAAQAQQAQQTKQQQAQQVSQQAHTRLQQELDKQTLTNQLLEQTVQGEILKKQLEQLQGAPKPSANVRFTPGPPAGQPSGGRGPSPPVRRKPTKQNGYIGAGGQRIPGEIDESRPGGVRTLKHNFEKHMHSALNPGMFQQAPAEYSHPSTYIDDVLNAPQRSTDGIPPPGSVDMVQPPPPPPPMPDSQPVPHVDASANEPVTKVAVAGKLGGKIQWPPKKDESHKKDVHVGRLMIDEKKKEDRPPLEGMPHTMKLIKDASTTGDHPTPRKTVGKLPLGTPAPPPPPPPPPMDTSKIATPVDVKHGDKDQASVSIDMASRKNALAQQLSKVGMLKGGNKPTTHDIQQKSQPMKSPAMVNSSPVTKYQAPPPPPPIPNDISALHDTPRPLMPTSIVKRSTDISPAESIADISTVDTKALENVHTVLHDNVKAPYVAYQHVPWKLHVRKELFTPTETIDNQSVIDLIFCQIVADVFSASMRIEKQDRMRMLSIMQNNGITPNSMLNKHKPQVKKMILDTAMEWPFYFSRLFHVQGGTKQPKLNMVAVGHSGVRLLTVEKDLFANTLQVMEHFKYEDIVDYSVPKPDTFQLHVGNRYIIIYTPKAYQLRDLIEAFCIECEKDVMYGRAVKSYRTREQTLLSFVEGDLIKVARNADTSTGWLYGSLRGKAGLFPSEYIKPLARHELPQKQPERPKPTALPISPGPQTNGHTNGYHEDSATSEYFFSQCRRFKAKPSKSDVFRNTDKTKYRSRVDTGSQRKSKKHRKYHKKSRSSREPEELPHRKRDKSGRHDYEHSESIVSEYIDVDNDDTYNRRHRHHDDNAGSSGEGNTFRLQTGSFSAHRRNMDVRPIYMPFDTASVGIQAMEHLALVDRHDDDDDDDDQWITETTERAVQTETSLNSSGNTPARYSSSESPTVSSMLHSQAAKLMTLLEQHYRKRHAQHAGKYAHKYASKRRFLASRSRLSAAAMDAERKRQVMLAERHHSLLFGSRNDLSRQDGDGISIPSAYDTLPPPTGKFSMMEFAMLYFRKSPYRYEMKRGADTGSIHGSIKMISSLKAKSIALQQQKKHSSGNWSWSEEVDMVKWSKSPIQASLLNLNPELNKISLECFFAIMQYMGDYPLNKGQKPSDCVYTIITACHNHFQIVDEVYCQLAKQTTSNRSVKPESLQQGWRMLAIMTAYYNCTDVLRPYLFKYLEQMAYDNQKRQHQAIAALSLHNLRTTIRFGGRKNVPSRIEVEAMTRGRNSKRQTCILPGGIPTVLNVRSSNVVLDCLTQICSRLQITDEMEREEMTIFYVIQSENRYCPLKRGEYMFDITTELMNQKKTFYLLFQRTSWVMPLVFTRNQLYIDVMFHQCIPDYLDGFMLPLSTALPSYIKEELSMLAALQFKAAEVPGQTQKERRELITYIPRNAMAASDALSWVQLITDAIKSLHNRSPHQCKVQFLEILSRWPLFGSTFFTIKSVSDQRIRGECLLAINKHGVHMLNNKTHETELKYKFDEIISTRRLQADNRTHYLEMKCGDLMRQKITRLETDQGSDISRLIAQYILILSKTTKHRPR